MPCEAADDKADNDLPPGDRRKKCSLDILDEEHIHFPTVRMIAPRTLHQLLTGAYQGPITNFLVIDCRYPYEYEGGHIRGAVNLWTNEEIMNYLLRDGRFDLSAGQSTALIFHCEFSAQRGPGQYVNLMEIDSRIMLSQGHKRLFPEMYLLHKGYKAYFETFPEDCEPCNYVPMKDPGYVDQLATFEQISATSKLSVSCWWEVKCSAVRKKDHLISAQIFFFKLTFDHLPSFLPAPFATLI